MAEVWEDERSHDAFDAKLRERIAAAGGPARPVPRKLDVHNMMSAGTVPAGGR